MWHDILFAIALLLIFEGIAPFLSPESTRRALEMMSKASDQTLRFCGLSAMIIGCLILLVVR